nr:MAG TPA: hypothetical protein [Caudoviricetes sp.]
MQIYNLLLDKSFYTYCIIWGHSRNLFHNVSKIEGKSYENREL